MRSRSVAILTGQVRDGLNFVRLLKQLAALPVDRVIVATWSNEPLDDFGAVLQSTGAEVLTTEPIGSDGWGNPTRQQLLLKMGLDACNPDDLVMKLRPDVAASQSYLARVAEHLGSETIELPYPAVFRAPIVVPWINPQIPFRIGDEFFAGTAQDLKSLNNVDPVVSLVCPHVGRFAAPFTMLPSVRWLCDSVFRLFAPSFAADQTGAVDRTLVTPARGTRRLRPDLYPFLRSLSDVPSYATCIADALVVCAQHYIVLNPDPREGPVLSRLGGPWSDHKYTNVALAGGPWCEHSRFGIAYSVDPLELATSSGSSDVLARVRSVLEQQERIGEPLGAVGIMDTARVRRRFYRAAIRDLIRPTVLGGRLSRRLKARPPRRTDPSRG